MHNPQWMSDFTPAFNTLRLGSCVFGLSLTYTPGSWCIHYSLWVTDATGRSLFNASMTHRLQWHQFNKHNMKCYRKAHDVFIKWMAYSGICNLKIPTLKWRGSSILLGAVPLHFWLALLSWASGIGIHINSMRLSMNPYTARSAILGALSNNERHIDQQNASPPLY